MQGPSDSHVQIDLLNLSENSAIIGQLVNENSTSGSIYDETAAYGPNSCGITYAVHLHYSIRWWDGSLTQDDLPVASWKRC